MQSLRAKLPDIRRLLARADELELSHGAVRRLRWFEYALAHQGNVSLACRYFGIARSTFLRWAMRFDPLHPETIEEKSRRPYHVRSLETDPKAIELIRQIRLAQPQLGKQYVQKILQEQHGIILSTSTVGRVIERHKFFFAETSSHQTKRSAELETPSLDGQKRPRPSEAEGLAGQEQLPFPGISPNVQSS